MNDQTKLGYRLRLSPARRLMRDYMYFSKKTPFVCIEKEMELSQLVDIRNRSPVKISWFVIFIKAFSLVAEQYSPLRRAYLSFPFSHFYEYATTSCMLALERFINDEPIILTAKLVSPEKKTLFMLDSKVKELKNKPINDVSFFRHILTLNQLPFLMRRVVWYLALNFPWLRFHYFGTLLVTGVARWGVSATQILSTSGVVLSYDTINPSGKVLVRLLWDHRLFDGILAAEVMNQLELALTGKILDELRTLMPK